MNFWRLLYSCSVFTLTLLILGCSVKNSVVLVETNQLSKSHYKIDYQGNLYHIHQDVIDKYDRDNKILFTYSNKSLGAINLIDVSNPLRLLIFYKDQQKIVITDNTLSIHNSQSINLEDLGMYQVQIIASSKIDNGIWIYDQSTFQLTKLTPSLAVTYQSGNLTQLLGKKNVTPIMMVENNGFLFLVCPNNGVLIFDMYGAYYKTIPVFNVEFIHPSDQFVYIAHSAKVEAFHLKSVESAMLKLTQPMDTIFGFFDNRFYGLLNGTNVSSEFTIQD